MDIPVDVNNPALVNILSFGNRRLTTVLSDSGGGGGCTRGKNSEFDPLFPLLVVLSFVYLMRRRRRY